MPCRGLGASDSCKFPSITDGRLQSAFISLTEPVLQGGNGISDASSFHSGETIVLVSL